MESPVDVSVIISAFNRGEGLRETLQSVLTQDCGGARYEVIAVDNNSTDNTSEVIASFIASGHTNLRHLFEPRQGVSYGRNTGIRVARGSIIAFTDDDVVVAPDWIQSIARCFDQYPAVDYVTGKMLPIFDAPPPAWLTRESRGPVVLRDRGEQPLFSEPGCFFPGWATANIAFRRAVFEQVGLFSGEFPRGQDLELIIRVWRAGGRGMYAPDVRVSHRIAADRLTKAYHRMWHSREGDIRARVRFREIFDRDGRVVPADGVRLVFGVPPFLVRELVSTGVEWLRAWLRRDETRAFALEGELRQTARYIRTCFAGRNATPSSAPQLRDSPAEA